MEITPTHVSCVTIILFSIGQVGIIAEMTQWWDTG